MATLEIQGIGRVQVDDSFKSLPPDKQQQVVAEIVGKVGGARVGKVVKAAAELQPTKTERGMQEAARVFSQPNQMIADVAGAPVDVVNWGLRQIGVGSDKPILGSEWIKGQMEGLGVPVGITPQTPEGRVAGQALSGAVATLAPYALAQKFISSASPVVSGVARAVGTQPGAQIAAGAGAGAGGQIAEEVAPGNTWARLAGIFGGALAGGGLAARLSPANPAGQPTRELLGAFERQGVTPTLGAVGGPSAKIAQQTLASIPGAAGVIAKGAKRSLDETGSAVAALAEKWGTAGGPAQTGQAVQEGVARFAQDGAAGQGLSLAQIIAKPAAETSFRAKANALYQRLGQLVPTDLKFEAKNAGQALVKAEQRFNDPAMRGLFANPVLRGFLKTLAQTNGRLTWNDLRAFRSEIGEMIAKPTLTANVGRAQLEQLYAGLSRDILGAARAVGPKVERALVMADRFYKSGMDRIDGQLKKLFGADSPEAAWQKLIAAAGEKGGASIGRVYALKRSLPQDEWDEVASTLIATMGKPTAGQQLAEEGFSASTFLTNYAKLSPAGRDAIFKGSGREELAKSLDDLVNVVTAQKGLEKMTNASGTGRVALTGGLGALALSQPFTAAFTVIGARAAAKLMTSPAVVRWLAKAPAAAGTPTVWARQLRGLQAQAKNDPVLAQSLLALERALMAGEAQGAAQQPTPAR